METTLIGIGGINIRITLPGLSFRIEDSYLPFQNRSETAWGDWQVHPEPIPDPIRLVNNSARTSRIRDIRQSNGKLIFHLWWQPDSPFPWKSAIMDPASGRVDIWINRRERETVSYPLFALDLFLYPYLILPESGIIIHAAAVKIGQKAYLFPAPGGGGKSTWSDLTDVHPGWTVLGEDKVILRKVGVGYQVFGTPWNPRPEYRTPDNAPLRGIFFLQHSRENRISEIGKAEAATKLLQGASLPFQSNKELDMALTIVKDIAERIPAYQFGFKPDQSAIVYFSEKNKQ